MRSKGIKNTSVHSLRFCASAILVLLFGLTGSPAGAAPTVDQTPLTVATALPPNFVLMLDDSGSMAWDVMPDYDYLQDPTGHCVTTPDCLDSSDVNGVYYNPKAIYNPPMTVDGVTRMAPASFTSAHVDGFDSSSDVFDLRTYDGSDDTSAGSNDPTFSKTVSGTTTTSYAPTPACNSGDGSPLTSGPNAGKCQHATTQSTVDDGCQTQAQCNTDYANASNTVGGSKNWSGNKDTNKNSCGTNKKDCTWKVQNYSYYTPTLTCPAGGSLSGGQCQITATSNYGFFIYTVQTVTGTPPNATVSYTTYYVGASGSCAAVSATINASVCKDDAATQQNVANWFSYYHTRILMAKSGLMEAFSSLDPTIRFGYGSINGAQASWIQSNYSSLNYPFATDTKSQNYLAEVQPFGNGSSTGSQKSLFWTWVTNESANGSTPLRQALNAVGQYYMTDQPWQTSTSDNSKLACRQAYTILTTDGFWNESSVSIPSNSYSDNIDGGPGTTSTSSTTSPVDDGCKTQSQCNTDFSNASNTVSGSKNWSGSRDGKGNSCGTGTGTNQKKDCSWKVTTTSTSTAPAVVITGPPPAQYTYTATAPYSDTYKDTLADVAMYYWLTDLQPDTSTGTYVGVPNEVPTSKEDPAFWQHMTTFTIGLGFTPIDANGNAIDVNKVFAWANGGTAIDSFAWPQASNANNGSIYNIADLAHAAVNGHGGFYSATSPQTFASGIGDAIKRLSTRPGTGASLAANSTKLTVDTVTYQAYYYTGTWAGDLRAYSVSPSNGKISANSNWSAADSSTMPAAANRNIRTYNGTAMVAFKASSDLSSTQQTALSNAGPIQDIINYLRGDSSKEQVINTNGIYRNRASALGDIINSQPVYVGAPSPNLFNNQSFAGSTAYADFATTKASRTPVLWISANDGMTHEFRASDGVELFAYIPGAVITAGLASLSDPNYGSSTSNSQPHQDFNDGELTVADVCMCSGSSSPSWSTVLVGTTGRGLAKAVYALDVTDPSNPTLLWERSAGDGKASSADIGQMNGQPVIAQTADGVWSVLLGNGYNSTNGTAALLQFNLATGDLTSYSAGTATGNGLAAPAVWIGNLANDLATVAYAGDAKGSIYSFDLAHAGSQIFTTIGSQPVTAEMLAGKDPNTGNVWLFFGTGKFLASDPDLSDKSIQDWYGIIVQSATSSLVTNLTNATDPTTVLVKRKIITEVEPNTSVDPPTLGTRTISSGSAADLNNKSGWYIALEPPDATGTTSHGERMVTPNQFQGSLLIGTSLIPEATTDPCNPSGTGWIMAINPFTGASPTSNFFDSNGDGKPDTSSIGYGNIVNNPIFTGPYMLVSLQNGTNGSNQTFTGNGIPKRVSWRELVSH